MCRAVVFSWVKDRRPGAGLLRESQLPPGTLPLLREQPSRAAAAAVDLCIQHLKARVVATPSSTKECRGLFLPLQTTIPAQSPGFLSPAPALRICSVFQMSVFCASPAWCDRVKKAHQALKA